MDSISNARLQFVFPVLAEKVRTMAMMLEQEGIEIRVVQGLRTIAEQDALYAQGRTVPGKIVTNCKGGYSYHNAGLACDIVPSLFDKNHSYSPDWNNNHPSWARMIAIAKSLGLDTGSDWRTFKDWPHVQLTGPYAEGEPPEKVRLLLFDGRMEEVWKTVTEFYALS